MPAGEFMEWVDRLKSNPWGRHRTEQMFLQLLVFLAAGPSSKMLERVKLPWVEGVDRVRQVTPDQMRAFLMSIGGRPGG